MDHPHSFRRVLLLLLALNTFAFAQSLYQALVGNPEFLVLNRVTHADLFLFVLVFELLPALLLALVWLLIRRVKPSTAGTFFSFALWLLFVPFLFELHKRFAVPFLHFRHNTLLIVLPLALAAFLIFRYRSVVERFLLVVSPLIVLFPALFLWRAWHMVAPEEPDGPALAQTPVAAETGQRPPIFLIVFDEFTRFALLDPDGHIDAARFPNFAELARNGTWFANATANAEYTTRAVPVIVTGNFPHGNDASAAAYPNNLFRLLSPEYDITIHEAFTRFCARPEYHCPDAARVEKPGRLLRSAFELYVWRVAPTSVVVRVQAAALETEQQRFRQFLGEIHPATANARPVFEYMHLELPHAPYMLNPDGSLHETVPNSFEARLAGDEVALGQLRSDYLNQVQYVDLLLGQFVARLRVAGLYDPALIVVTTDHGVSWLPDAPGRTLTNANAGMILPIPLFIKLPGEQPLSSRARSAATNRGTSMPATNPPLTRESPGQPSPVQGSSGNTAANISELDVQSIDLTPTIAAVARVSIPWPVDGRNIFAPNPTPREKIAYDANGKKFVLPASPQTK